VSTRYAVIILMDDLPDDADVVMPFEDLIERG
jgi:hypothetical protein